MRRAKTRRIVLVLSIAIVGGITTWLIVTYFHVPSFHVVDAERLYRSGQPRDEWDWKRLKRGFGIRTVVNLRPWDEGDDDWKTTELAETREADIRCLHLPMKDTAVPTGDQADAFLEWVRDQNNWPVLVHCKAGKDRTGTMVALYRIQVQGWGIDAALEELRRIDGYDPLNEGVEEFLRTYEPQPSKEN